MSGFVPARLHVLFAASSPKAVVIRRGPSRHTAVIGWDRSTDRFTVGQWLRGRIYERRCDLSPDGEHLIYFAMNGRWAGRAKGAWTAISQAPYLTALSLFAKGDCWHGGGLFVSPREYWMNNGYGHTPLHDRAGLTRRVDCPWDGHFGGECPGVYYLRLQRDGWVMTEAPHRVDGDGLTVFEKPVNAHWRLRKTARATIQHPVGRGCYFDVHALINTRSGEVVDKPGWEWAEVDGKRLVWAEAGKLFSARPERAGLSTAVPLYDFNPLKFERLTAPC